jgi:HSP20 family molecular chaperone IbpA
MAMFPALMNDSMFSDLFDDPFFAGWRGTRANSSVVPEGSARTQMMSTDVKDNGNSYDVDIDMPGFKKDDIQIQLENGYLTVSAHREQTHTDNGGSDNGGANGSGANATASTSDASSQPSSSEGESGSGTSENDSDGEGKWLRRERYFGSCSRSFYVGDDVKESDIHAKYQDGTLCLQIPKNVAPQVEQPHTIAIEG